VPIQRSFFSSSIQAVQKGNKQRQIQTDIERKPLSMSHCTVHIAKFFYVPEASTLSWRNTVLFVCGFSPNLDFSLFFSKYHYFYILKRGVAKLRWMGAARSAPFLRISETKKTIALSAAKIHSLDLFVFAMAFTFQPQHLLYAVASFLTLGSSHQSHCIRLQRYF
jgi:hypothetical protein